MISPFIKLDITMKLSYRDLTILLKTLMSNVPDSADEQSIIHLHNEVQKQLRKIETL